MLGSALAAERAGEAVAEMRVFWGGFFVCFFCRPSAAIGSRIGSGAARKAP